MKTKKKDIRSRSWVAEMMGQTTRPATFKDRKKESSRKACRNFKRGAS